MTEDTRAWVGRETEPPSGTQHVIQAGQQRATIVEVGGGVREYEVDGRPVLDPYPVDAIADGARGTPLLPWPNRLEDGRYVFDGKEYQVPLTEPEKGDSRPDALAAVAADRSFGMSRRHGRTRLSDARYPFDLDVAVEYRLDDDGLTVTTTAKNVGRAACPYGYGQHPYLSPGTGVIDECVLRLEAATRIVPDERGLPTGRGPVDGTPYDFRDGKQLSDLRIDSAFTDRGRDADGRAWATLAGDDGRTVEFWVDRHHHARPEPTTSRARLRTDDLPAQRIRHRHRPCASRARRVGEDDVGRPDGVNSGCRHRGGFWEAGLNLLE